MDEPPYSDFRDNVNLSSACTAAATSDIPEHRHPDLNHSPDGPERTLEDVQQSRTADAELLRRLRLGDERALEAVFRAHYAPMCAVVRRIVFAPDVAEELVQDVFFRFWSKRKQIAEIDALKTYLIRAARNTALNHLRRQKLEQAHEEREAALGEPYTIESADEATTAGELTEVVNAAVSKLPPRCREVFLMSRDGGLTYTEIAREMGISIKTVETQMGRALKTLRTLLAGYRDLPRE